MKDLKLTPKRKEIVELMNFDSSFIIMLFITVSRKYFLIHIRNYFMYAINYVMLLPGQST